MPLVWAIGASIIVSIISLIGVVTLALKEKFLNKILILLIGFAAGGLIGGAFFHLLPEALEGARADTAFTYTILGFIAFFILERYFHWRHCHEGGCDVHAFTYLNLIGDGLHNFIDGMVIGASFMVGIKLGVVTTLVIIFHEIPQEIGDFGILVYGGFNKLKALAYNFLSGLTAVAGAAAGWALSGRTERFSVLLLPFMAGGFIYVAGCDLIPELHKEARTRKAALSLAAFILGLAFMWSLKFIAR